MFTVSSLCACVLYVCRTCHSTANKLLDHIPRRGGGTLTRKQHASPAFQPPLPPVEGALGAAGAAGLAVAGPGPGAVPGQSPAGAVPTEPQLQPQQLFFGGGGVGGGAGCPGGPGAVPMPGLVAAGPQQGLEMCQPSLALGIAALAAAQQLLVQPCDESSR